MSNIELKGKQEFMGKEIQVIEGGFGEGKKCLTDNAISEIHDMQTKNVRARINDNIKRFKDGTDFIDLKDILDTDTLIKMGYSRMMISKAKNIFLFSETGYLKLVTIMKGGQSIAENMLVDYFDSELKYIPTNTKEYYFYEILKEQLEVFGIFDLKIQYKVLNYKIDAYIPSLNIAIEYDENNHENYTYDQHEGRQKQIEKELGCKFLRVTDDYSINVASAMVLKKLVA